MKPRESALAILRIMVGFGVKGGEIRIRGEVNTAFLGLGTERTTQEFDDGVAYAVEQKWLIEEDATRLKLTPEGFQVGSN